MYDINESVSEKRAILTENQPRLQETMSKKETQHKIFVFYFRCSFSLNICTK